MIHVHEVELSVPVALCFMEKNYPQLTHAISILIQMYILLYESETCRSFPFLESDSLEKHR